MFQKNVLTFLILLFFQYPGTLFSQSTFNLTEGFFLPLDLNYGREAVVQDKLAYQLFNGTFTYPSGDNLVFSDRGEELYWKPIETDSTGEFSGELLSEGYLYLVFNSDEEKEALLNFSGHNMTFFNGAPHAGDIYKHGWLYIPVRLKKGRNDILVRCSRWARWQGIKAKLLLPEKPVFIDTGDPTLPHIVLGQQNEQLLGAVVITNTTDKALNSLVITSVVEGREKSLSAPSIPSMTSRKVAFHFDAGNISDKGSYTCSLQLKNNSKLIDEKEITVEAVGPGDHYSEAFISEIDGSVQYYGVTPQSGENTNSSALFLSVHGAGVEAIGQARAYRSKDWGVLVAPTNRRPRGFNWEDWGRIDALEVLEIAKEKFNPDPEKIYLTGHSMGGHGTWYLGATYPGRWAAIGPCAAYPTLKVYGSSDGEIPEESNSDVEEILLQASNPSNVIDLAKNYNAAGVYIHHGDSDKVVSVEYARQMRKLLGEFHKDFNYYEYPGGSHWFGSESVDWPPMFEYFKWHSIPTDSAVDVVDFTTPSPAISSQYFWVEVLQQVQSLKLSNINIRRSKPERTIKGTTTNLSAVAFNLHDFSKGDTLKIELDEQQPLIYVVESDDDRVYLENLDSWSVVKELDPNEKGVRRGGTFKEPFNHQMVFVYGTKGNGHENRWSYEKAMYDAEVWYYRGNGAVDIIADKNFNLSEYVDRGVILYGNSKTNGAWGMLLADCPVQVQQGKISVGDKEYIGSDLGAYFMWPRPDSQIASVAVVSGSGIEGMRATESNQYFAAGSGFPDFLIFSLEMLRDGASGIKCAGFYSNDWKVDLNNSAFVE